jgi:hypothetical protein
VSEIRDGIIARFENVAGALVELHPMRYTTRYDSRGNPYLAREPYEIDGFNWRCLGCAEYGFEGERYDDAGYRHLKDARTDAQTHAARCRAVPQTVQAPRWEYLTEYFTAKWETVEDVLDRRGPDGWELVTVHWDAHQAVFKRPAVGGAR